MLKEVASDDEQLLHNKSKRMSGKGDSREQKRLVLIDVNHALWLTYAIILITLAIIFSVEVEKWVGFTLYMVGICKFIVVSIAMLVMLLFPDVPTSGKLKRFMALALTVLTILSVPVLIAGAVMYGKHKFV
jgi:hypothetical protein